MAETECERVEWVVLGVAFLPGHSFQSSWGHLSRAELVTAASEGQLPVSPASGPGELLTLLFRRKVVVVFFLNLLTDLK